MVLQTISMEDRTIQESFLFRCQLILYLLVFPVDMPTFLFESVLNDFYLSGDLLEFFEHKDLSQNNFSFFSLILLFFREMESPVGKFILPQRLTLCLHCDRERRYCMEASMDSSSSRFHNRCLSQVGCGSKGLMQSSRRSPRIRIRFSEPSPRPSAMA